jgi:hypothetical protein
MALKLQHGLFTLALSSLLLAPVAARAEGSRWGGQQHEASAVGDSRAEQHFHTGGCYHPAPTPPQAEPPRSQWPRQQGRYELQTVQKWVEGRYEQVWVEQTCRYKPRHHRTKCQGGYYEQRWGPGYYQPVQEWVWVPARRGHYAVATNGW